jgi:glutamyl-Q tRNA(Asp) synthetase
MLATRFAPSPTGYLHSGHAFSALFAAGLARRAQGRFVLRIEDIDAGRCRPEFAAAIFEDLAWLGLTWETPVRWQSQHMAAYQAALGRLEAMGVLYKCFCTRADIKREIEAAGAAPHAGEPLYPGTCRHREPTASAALAASGIPYAQRLNLAAACRIAGPLAWHDREAGTQIARPELLGDVVLARKDVPASYHLCVVLDDHLQRITLVTRGQDLFAATHLHRLLQKLLDLDTPDYCHHRLLTDGGGARLAKRAGSMRLRDLRAAGQSPAAIIAALDLK